MLEIFLKWLIPFVCGAAVAGAVTYFKMRKAKDRAVENGVQCLLRCEIIRTHEKYSEQGWCPVHIKEALKREYSAYSALGGNDVAKEMYHELLEMPVKAKEQQR